MEIRREIQQAPERPSSHPKPLPPLIPPPDQHLLITTENKIHAWHAEKTRVLFSSSDGGIVAAKETEDGTGLLAVADSHVVVLCKKGETRKKYKLKADDGCLGLISFANGYKDIFFSTSLQTSLRCYSIEEDRLLEFCCTHPSPPAAIAVSKNSTYLVSASPLPPTVYLQDLRVPGSKIHFQPHASDAQVTVASFHPDRDEIFLLAYSDGTLSVHTASRIILMKSIGSDGNIGHLKRAQRIANARVRKHERKTNRGQISSTGLAKVGDKCIGITAAAFMGEHKLRVVSVSGDGKCRVSDFEHGASILRTWHTQSACTSLAISSPKISFRGSNWPHEHQPLSRDGTEIESSCIIAIGRADGCLLFYDALGLLRDHILVERGRGRIVDIAWVPNEMSHLPKSALDAVLVQPSDISDVDWTFNSATSNRRSTPQNLKNIHENESPKARLIDSLRSKRAVSTHISIPKPLSARANSEGIQIVTPPNHNAVSNPSPVSTVVESVQRGRDAFSPTPTEKLSVEAYNDSKGACQSDSEFKFARQYQTDSANPFVDDTSPKSVASSNLGASHMPCAWVESSSSFGSPLADPLKRLSPQSPMSISSHLPHRLRKHLDKRLLHKGLNQRMPSPLSFPTSSVTPLENSSPLDQAELSSGLGWKSDFEDSPTWKESRQRNRTIRAYTTRDAATRSPTLRRKRSVSHMVDSPSLIIKKNLGPEYREYDSISAPKAPPSSPSLLMKTLPKIPEIHRPCECDCADVIREEMALVRAEIAALRKSLWVFGGQIERAGLKSLNGSPNNAQKDLSTSVGKGDEQR